MRTRERLPIEYNFIHIHLSMSCESFLDSTDSILYPDTYLPSGHVDELIRRIRTFFLKHH